MKRKTPVPVNNKQDDETSVVKLYLEMMSKRISLKFIVREDSSSLAQPSVYRPVETVTSDSSLLIDM